jgi:hypothetical protein
MAIAHDASSVSGSSVSQSSFQWTHTPSGTSAGVWVAVFNLSSSTDTATSVSYGESNVPAVSGGRAVDLATEPGSCKLFFLGSGIPTGAQTVTITRTFNADLMYAVACTQTSAGVIATEVVGIQLLQDDGTVAEQSVIDGNPGTSSLRYAAGYFGHDTLPTAGANSTETGMQSLDAGGNGFVTVRESSGGQGARDIGFSSGITADRAAVHFAVREISTLQVLIGELISGYSEIN